MTQLVRGAWGPFLTLRDGDGVQIKPYESSPTEEDMITIWPQGDNVVAFRASNGKFMSATNGGGSTVLFNAFTVGPNEKFTLQWLPGNNSYFIWCPDGVHALRAPNCVGQYITANTTPGGFESQFCFHNYPIWFSPNKYIMWAYCSDGIGPGVFWPELSRPDGMPTYQQIDITAPETIDILDYIICDDVIYDKYVAINSAGDGKHCYWYYFNPNGDIDIFVMRYATSWNMEYVRYVASDQIVRFMYDCEDSQPNVDCGEACRFSMRESDTHKPAKWMKRFWKVGDVIDSTNSEGTSWHNNKTPCYPWNGPGFTRILARKFIRDWGGDIGIRDSILMTFDNLDSNNNIRFSEITIYAKKWGLVYWDVVINGVLQHNSPIINRIVSYTKVMPDFTSICPETYVPQVPVYEPGDNEYGGMNMVFVITGDNTNTLMVPTGWNNINVIRNLNQVKKDYANGWDATNKRYVAKTAGKYFLIGNVQWTGLDSGSSYASIIKNGNSVTNIGISTVNAYSYGPVVIGIVDLNVGDYVQLSVCQNSGHNMYVTQWENVSFQGFLLKE